MSPRQRRNAGRNAGSLRGQLVSNALVSIALPLFLAGAVVFFFLNYHLQIIESSFARSQEALTRDIAGTDIRAQARNAARQLDEFLIERITEAKAWAAARVVVDAARRAHERHRAAGLVGAPTEEIEARFHRRKSLGIAPPPTRTCASRSPPRPSSPKSSSRTATGSTSPSPTRRATSSSPTRPGGRTHGADSCRSATSSTTTPPACGPSRSRCASRTPTPESRSGS